MDEREANQYTAVVARTLAAEKGLQRRLFWHTCCILVLLIAATNAVDKQLAQAKRIKELQAQISQLAASKVGLQITDNGKAVGTYSISVVRVVEGTNTYQLLGIKPKTP